ncbi:hypothetical protein N7505_004739 [Penicillium chrysogenum]|uniref:BZIP domain-containing protein n=1 Tax=Penicillium chrysogenum TaxID=5076 RepID=A0ABQ8WGU2_PENCH|nr:hypothetical protein N7505_004739 [Penicillium chrysogenum]
MAPSRPSPQNGAARRKLRKLRRGDRPPLGPGEIGPNNARNRALKKRRRQAQAAREQAAVVEARRRELENEFAVDMVRARANARLASLAPRRLGEGVPWPTAVISVVVLSAVVLSVAVGPVAALSTGPKLTLANARPPAAGDPLPDADEDEPMLVDEARAVPNEGAAQNDACARRGPVPQYEQEHRRA